MKNSGLSRHVTALTTSIATVAVILLPTFSFANMALAPQWTVKDEPEIPACSLQVVTAAVTLHFSRGRGRQEAVMQLNGADLPEEFSFYWQTDSGPRHRLTAFEDRNIGAYRIGGSGTPIDTHDLLLELEPVTYLSLAITARSVHKINIANFVAAFSEYRACIDRLNAKPAQETAATVSKEEPPVIAENDEGDDKTTDLAENLSELSSEVIGEFHCQVSGSNLLGVPDISGRDNPTSVTLAIFEDGSATYNGKPLQPQVNEKAADGTADFFTYDVRDITRAIMPDANAPPVIGLNEEEMEAYGKFLGAGNTMMQMVLGDRSRSLFVSTKNGNVVFFDYRNDGEIANQSAPECLRIR